MAESRGGTPRGERAAIRARRTSQGAAVGYASLGVPLPCFLPFVLGNAGSTDREMPEPPPAFSGEDRCGERRNSRRVTMTRVRIASRERDRLFHLSPRAGERECEAGRDETLTPLRRRGVQGGRE